MRKLLLTSIFLGASALSLSPAARADSVTLVTGEKLEGTIKSETDAGVTIEVKVSSGITDERTIPRAEISKIDKVTPDELAYAELKSLKPDPQSSFSSETYDRIIAALKNFQAKYPRTLHYSEVQLDLDVFQKEKERVDAGEVKYLGQWLSKEEAEKRSIQIEGFEQFAAMRQQAARNDMMGALLTFDQLEKTHGNTRAYPDAVDLARKLLPLLQAEIANCAKTLGFQQAQFQKEVAMTSTAQRNDLINAYKREQAQFDAAIAEAAMKNAKWPPFFARSAKSLDAVQRTATAEISRLAGIPTQKMRDSINRVDQAKTAMTSGDLKGADSLLKQAVSLWPPNEDAAFLGAQLKEKQAAASATPATSPSPKPSPSPSPRASATPAANAGADGAHKSFFRTVPGALTVGVVVAAIVGGITMMNKARAAGSADSE